MLYPLNTDDCSQIHQSAMPISSDLAIEIAATDTKPRQAMLSNRFVIEEQT